jgi:hypothetical protein
MSSVAACAAVSYRGVQRRRLRTALIGLWRRVRPLDEQELIREV